MTFHIWTIFCFVTDKNVLFFSENLRLKIIMLECYLIYFSSLNALV